MEPTNQTRGRSEWSEANPKADIYRMAQAKVRKLKKFYFHLIIYCTSNATLLLYYYNHLDAHESLFTFHYFSTAFYWGIGLVAHAATVFVPNFIFGNKWEDRKMKEFMEREKKSNWE